MKRKKTVFQECRAWWHSCLVPNSCLARMPKDILREALVPLHVTEIIKRAKDDYQTIIDRESIVSAITKKVNKGDTFIRVDRNTFALKTKE